MIVIVRFYKVFGVIPAKAGMTPIQNMFREN
ncbi:hypothetical protein A1C_00935 [Rickettsia akari str. Hartford]|uniref:Uncharacterized protein n=1 Tax=Rickettsia akari (strain Hartford) TaxID=293614 RepID=A8GM92_RICAH|nr:hypothetical protein A1C_00935 [Rickettsia akari str. Hartford]